MREYDRREERTGVQESADFDSVFDVQSDFVMVYGLHDLRNRVKKWKKAGYVIHLMTGVSWGNYQDYLYGKFDGIDHHDEGQLLRDGSDRSHGKDVPYMVPSNSFAHYLSSVLRYAVDCGVEAIHLEEPEFWADTGYSDAFKREWKIYYKEDWVDPQSSCDAQYRASKLKQYLYTRTLDRLCSELKEYALVKYGRLLRFYVPTHSLINYSQWKIVSPESALIDLPSIDGYIAQIWTGTARAQNVCRGVKKERTFETAFLEYGVMQELVRGTGRRMWFLADPIEDNPRHTWVDYRENYYRTVVASLFHPEISDYEVSPWPARVMRGRHHLNDGDAKEMMTEFARWRENGGDPRKFRPEKDTRAVIPPEYKTNLLTVMHALRDMKDQSDHAWIGEPPEIAVAIADSAMFQRICPEDGGDDGAEFSSFFGLSLPLLKAGAAVRPVQLDNVRRFPAYLDAYKTLVLSYEFIKPCSPDINEGIAGWVRRGGTLIYVGRGCDPFSSVREWWNADGRYDSPAKHLFEALGVEGEEGTYTVGKGRVSIAGYQPREIAEDPELSDKYRDSVLGLTGSAGTGAALLMRRGAYVISAGMDETGGESTVLKGDYIDMFSESLRVVEDPEITPGSVGLWYDAARIDRSTGAFIIALSARAEKICVTQRKLTFTAKAPSAMNVAARVYTARPPKKITVNGAEPGIPFEYEGDSRTTFFTFPSEGKPVKISVKY